MQGVRLRQSQVLREADVTKLREGVVRMSKKDVLEKLWDDFGISGRSDEWDIDGLSLIGTGGMCQVTIIRTGKVEPSHDDSHEGSF